MHSQYIDRDRTTIRNRSTDCTYLRGIHNLHRDPQPDATSLTLPLLHIEVYSSDQSLFNVLPRRLDSKLHGRLLYVVCHSRFSLKWISLRLHSNRTILQASPVSNSKERKQEQAVFPGRPWTLARGPECALLQQRISSTPSSRVLIRSFERRSTAKRHKTNPQL